MAGRTPSGGHAPPWWGLAGTGIAGTPPPSSGRAPHGTRVRPDGLGTTGRHPSGPQRAGHTWPSSQRATTGRAPTGRHPSGHATRVGRIGCLPSAACPRGVVEPPNDSALAAPLGSMNRAQLPEPRQRRQLHAVVRRAGRMSGRTQPGTRRPPPRGAPRGGWCVRRHGPCAGHGPTGGTEGPPGSPAPGTRPHRAPAPAAARATPPWGHTRGRPRRGAPPAMRLPHPHGLDRRAGAGHPAVILPPRVAADDGATGQSRYPPSAHPASLSWSHGPSDACRHPLPLRNPANGQRSAAPLAGV